MKRNAQRLAVVLALGVMLFCGAFTSVVFAEKVFRMQGLGLSTLDISYHDGGMWIHMLGLSEGLMKWGKDVKPIPGMAESYTVSKDGLVYTFKIRKDARWSNGDPVTAYDFEYGMKRTLNPKYGKGSFFGGLWYIKNAKDFAESQIDDPNKVGIKALDAHTLQITLDEPHPDFITTMALPTAYPVHKASVEKLELDAFKPGNLVTNGPYKLQSWTPNVEIVLVKNPYYYDADKVDVDKVVGLLGGNAFLMYQRDEVDLISVGAAQLPIIEKNPTLKKELKIFDQSTSNLMARLISTNPALFDDIRVRLALSKAIDREKICKYVFKGLASPVYSWVTSLIPGSAANDPDVVDALKFDLKKARELLAEAGYPGGRGFPTIHFLVTSAQTSDPLVLAVKSEWEKNLGIKVVIDNLEPGVWSVKRSDIYPEDYAGFYFTGYSVLYPDPAAPLTLNYVEWMALQPSLKAKDMVELGKLQMAITNALKAGDTKKASDLSHASKKLFYERASTDAKKVLELVLKAQKESDPKKRLELYSEANKIRDMRIVPFIPLVQSKAARLLKSRVTECPFNQYLVGFPVSFAYIKMK